MLLEETDIRVDEEQDDTDEILPVRSMIFAIGRGDDDRRWLIFIVFKDWYRPTLSSCLSIQCTYGPGVQW